MSRTCLTCIFVCVLLLGIAISGQSPAVVSSDKVYLGVLDDAREQMVNWKPGVAQERVVRPAFEKTAVGWKQVDAAFLPAHMNWTVAFDGKNLGSVTTQIRQEEGFTLIQNILTPASAIPVVGSPSQQFAGIMAVGSTKVRRPLITVSKPYFHDPDGWKRAELPDETAASVRKAFRSEYPSVARCKDEEVIERNWQFPDSALAFPVVYASNKHSFLVKASLNAGDCGWVDRADDPLSEPWFFVSEAGPVRRIGSFMSLIDAGDYDNDGKSEVVFLLSQGENTDGFVLFDASFEKQTSVLWHYH
jgi:hypothetical protein